jgi:2-dehydropantoate 2-reductase
MNFLCFGVGAIGTYIGGSLAASGQRVVFIDRPAVADQVRLHGLHLRYRDQEKHVSQPEVVGSLAEAIKCGPFDAAILAVKSFDTPAVMAEAQHYRDQMPSVLCLQNGVENEIRIAEKLGLEKVVSATVTTAIGRVAVGNITVEKLRGVGVALDHPSGGALVTALNAAGLKAKGYPHGPSLKWSKMLTNLLANASSAILNMSPAEIFSHPGLYRVEMMMYIEALAVMDAQAIGVCDLPATPVRLLSWIIRNTPAGISRPLLVQSLGKGRGGKMPSFHIDLYNGRGSSEVDYLNGAVVRFGERFRVAAPINRWLNQTLLAMTSGSLAKAEYARQPKKFIQDITTGRTSV